MNITKRDFIKLSGCAAAGCGSVLAATDAPKVRIAAIGTGGRGHTDLHSFLRSGLCEISCAADADGVKWWIAECECGRDSLHAIAESYKFLQRLGRC